MTNLKSSISPVKGKNGAIIKGQYMLSNVKILFAQILEKNNFGKYKITLQEPKDSEFTKNLKNLLDNTLKETKTRVKEDKNYPIELGADRYKKRKEDIEFNEKGLSEEDVAKKLQGIKFYQEIDLISCVTQFQPKVYNRKGQIITDLKDILWSGAIVNVNVSLFTYKKESSGISINLNAFQLMQEGEAFGQQDFGSCFEVFDDVEEENKTSLFDNAEEFSEYDKVS